MKYFILLIITSINISAFSQTIELKLKEKTIGLKVSSTNIPIDNIVEIIKDENQNDIFVYSNFLGIIDIKEGPYVGEKTGNYQEGVAFMNGSKFKFSEKEMYICNIGNKIYTRKIDFLNISQNINVYLINNNTLTKSLKSITIGYDYSFERIPNCDFLILSNIDETVGDEVKIYDKDLNIVLTQNPYKEGLSEFFYTSIDENIYVFYKPSIYSNSKNKYKVSIINTQTNFSIEEINNEGGEPKRIISIGDKIFLICQEKIMLFNKQVELLWSKNLNVSESEISTIISGYSGRILVTSEGAIVCINIKDGSELWRKPLKDIYPVFEEPISKRNELFIAYVRVDVKALDSLNLIGILSAKLEHYSKDNLTSYSNKYLTLMDYEGNIVKNISLKTSFKSSIDSINYTQGKVKICHLLAEDYGFKIINDGRIEKYEK